MDAIILVRSAFLVPIAAILLAYAASPIRSRFLAYGARAAPSNNDGKLAPALGPLDKAAAITVPHSWFTSFYYTCVSCSLVWACDYLSASGTLASRLASLLSIEPNYGRPSMSFDQVLLTWLLVFAQGSRRLYESHTFVRSSASRMWCGHWAIGIIFYSVLSVAVWVEGIPTLQSHKPAITDFTVKAPSLRTLICLCGFAAASGIQHDCHAYLFSLKAPTGKKTGTPEYKTPEHPAFNKTLTPHYFAECCIYVALTFVAAPSGSRINGTMLCAMLFVVGNLAITAIGTREWYAAKFGKAAVEGKARMVPFFF